jgi:hypothetical protein
MKTFALLKIKNAPHISMWCECKDKSQSKFLNSEQINKFILVKFSPEKDYSLINSSYRTFYNWLLHRSTYDYKVIKTLSEKQFLRKYFSTFLKS